MKKWSMKKKKKQTFNILLTSMTLE